MIRPSDIDQMLKNGTWTRETIEGWCVRNGIEETVVDLLVEVCRRDAPRGMAAVEGFRVGHEVRQSQETQGQRSPDGPRFAVQAVVVDTMTGQIIGNATPDAGFAEDLAGLYNTVAAEDPRGFPGR